MSKSGKLPAITITLVESAADVQLEHNTQMLHALHFTTETKVRWPQKRIDWAEEQDLTSHFEKATTSRQNTGNLGK